MRTESRELLAVGVFGGKSRGFESRLGERIEILLRRGRTFSPRASVVEVVTSAVVLGALLLAGALTPRWIAFAQQQPRPSFEVASVKPTPAARRGFDYGTYFRNLPGGRFSAGNVPLGMLIMKAYSVDSNQIVGGNWLRFGAETYDIEARADDRDPRFKAADAAGPAAKEALQDSMLQALLTDRFKLAIHRETKETSRYALVVAKGGPKLKSGVDARRNANGPCLGPVPSHRHSGATRAKIGGAERKYRNPRYRPRGETRCQLNPAEGEHFPPECRLPD